MYLLIFQISKVDKNVFTLFRREIFWFEDFSHSQGYITPLPKTNITCTDIEILLV